MKLLKLGTIALSDTKVKVNTSKIKTLSYGHAKKLEVQLKAEVKVMTERAEAAIGMRRPIGSVAQSLERIVYKIRRDRQLAMPLGLADSGLDEACNQPVLRAN